MTSLLPRVRVRVRPNTPKNDDLIAAAATAVRHAVDHVPPATLKRLKERSRTTPRRKVDALAAMMSQFKVFTPLLVDETGTVIAGDARLQAALKLGLTEVPIISVTHLTEAERRAFIIADNQISQLSVWDEKILRNELKFLVSIDLSFSLELTGFSMPDIEKRVAIGEDQADPDPDDFGLLEPAADPVAITRRGDIWQTVDGRFRIICGDSQTAATYEAILGSALADLVATDAPYNLKVQGFIGGKGKVRRREFHEASGEMTRDQFQAFLANTMGLTSSFSRPGALQYYFMDWRHMEELLAAGRAVFERLLNICFWRKTTGGMGGLYRNAHEMCAVFAKGGAPYVNNVQLGRFGRNRCNVWTHQGANTFRKGRQADLEAHPTVKPVELMSDIIQDASHLNDLVLDVFLGSGTTLLAAFRTGRRCAGIEIDPLYVDVSIRRIQKATGLKFVHRETGQAFDDRAALVGAGE